MHIKPASFWIEQLQLQPHPEGGFYKETYRSSGIAPFPNFDGDRSFATAIYFLLRSNDQSHFHRIKSDELWHYHAGGTLTIYILTDGGLRSYNLGNDIEAGDQLQVVVPANHWFGARVIRGSYALAGCTVSPGFDFRDFEMAKRNELLHQFPAQGSIIESLTLD